MPIDAQQENRESSTGSKSKAALWIGWILTVLTTLFMLFDTFAHYAMPQPVVDAFVRLGLPASRSAVLATIELICVALYVVPQTAVLGAVLLTGYFGGATAIHLRAGSPLFETVFPVILGGIAWAGIYLREGRLHRLIPARICS
ncbi:MAG TPA: DoxX family protein [Terracidiphilus sp.]|nr:DoxX family protein [Terracidiphilus sp.]